MVHDDVRTLAGAYQRIPAEYLRKISSLQPLNYAVLLGGNTEEGQHSPHRGCIPVTMSDAKWQVCRLNRGVNIQGALIALEKANAALDGTPVLRFQLNFSNGAYITLRRGSAVRASSLEWGSFYDPSGVFTDTTRRWAQESFNKNIAPRLKFLVDSNGRALDRRPRLSSFDPAVLYRHAPPPFPVSQTGFAFTPVSMLSFQMRPAETVAGCRPGIRETNPAAVNYRPRVLSRTVSPNNLYEAIDERNRKSPDRGAMASWRPSSASGVGRRSPFTPGKARPRTATAPVV